MVTVKIDSDVAPGDSNEEIAGKCKQNLSLLTYWDYLLSSDVSQDHNIKSYNGTVMTGAAPVSAENIVENVWKLISGQLPSLVTVSLPALSASHCIRWVLKWLVSYFVGFDNVAETELHCSTQGAAVITEIT